MIQPTQLLRRSVRAILGALCALAFATAGASNAAAQPAADTVIRITLPVAQAFPLQTAEAISRVAVTNPDIADAVVVDERDAVINGKAIGTTDIVLWFATQPRVHYRVTVRAAAARSMVLLSVRLAEVRRDMLRQIGVSGIYRDKDGKVRVGTGQFANDNAFDANGNVILPTETRFFSVLSNLGTKEFLGLLEAEEKLGRARLLAEPNLLTLDGDSATFLAGGELPIPVAQPGLAGQVYVTIQYREFGVRLRFAPQIVDDTLINLWVRPEVSSLDYGNAVNISGFLIPALRTRRVESSVDVKDNESLIISGLFNEEREQVKTGIPLLMHIPVIGNLFSSTRWQSNESELLVVVTPVRVDPANVGSRLLLPIRADTTLPAREAVEKRLPPPPAKKP